MKVASYVESVTDGDLESYIDQMVDEGVKVIFTTSTTFMDGTIASAARYPDVMFFNASGYKHAPNVATYQADTYQCCYLEGLAAGALTKNGKIGSVSSYPTPEVVRIVDGFTVGLHEVNPKALVNLRWLNTWYDPPAAKEAAEALLSEGADVLVSDMDSPTVAEVGEAHGVPTNGPSIDTYKEAPNTLIASAVYNWGAAYTSILTKVHDGTYTPKNLQNLNLWARMAEGSAQLLYKPGVMINPRYKDALTAAKVDDGKGGKISVYDLILKRIAQMSATPVQFEPFTGPLYNAKGKLEIPAGQMATQSQLFGMNWRLPQIIGNWPSE
jgi:basic membrane protein A